MPWIDVETRLAKAFATRVSFPSGIISFPVNNLNIDEWLTSAAETDEELRELDIPRIRFLQNRWQIEEVVQFEWEADRSITRRSLWAMYIGSRAYMLFSGGFKYHLVAALDPRDATALYGVVLRRLLEDRVLIPVAPTHITIRRHDLVESIGQTLDAAAQPLQLPAVNHYMASLLVGWIGHWIDMPVFGYWHEEAGEPGNQFHERGAYAIHPNVWRQTAGEAKAKEKRNAP